MSTFFFNRTPQDVPFVKTKFRLIQTNVPTPQSLSLLSTLEKYEARSMHGQLPVDWQSAVDFQVFDSCGNCWIDFTSTIFVANTGHANQAVKDAIAGALNQNLLHTYTFTHQYRAEFLKELIAFTEKEFQKAFLLSSGTEATECALKLMRLSGQRINQDKMNIVSFLGSMHGRTMGAELLSLHPQKSQWIGHHDPHSYQLPFPYPWDKEVQSSDYDGARHFRDDISVLIQQGLQPEKIAGFMIESYQGWAAAFYPKSYIQELEKFAHENHALLCFDEIQSGFGRTGKLWGFEHYRVSPDLICVGKALSGGLPLSVVLGKKEILDLPETGSMSSTHSANPLCCAAGLANIKELKVKNLIKESQRKGKILHKYLQWLQQKYDNRIAWVCGEGMVAAIIFVDPCTGRPDTVFPSRVCEKAMQKGLLLVYTGRESIKIGPPLTIPDEALLEGLNVLEESIRAII